MAGKNAISKAEFLQLIRKQAIENGGVPPGQKNFHKSTGLSEHSWRGVYWARWGDALQEAGFERLKAPPRFEDDFLLESICKLVTSLGKFPTNAEILLAKRTDPSFPHRSVIISRWSTMGKLAREVAAFAKGHSEYATVIPFCGAPTDDTPDEAITSNGWLYLVTDGRRYKVGRTQSIEDRIPELAYQSSHRIDLVHKFQTDDPVGIEKYWHERFSTKRKFGEWFELDAQDVAAFRSRKRFM